MASLGNNRLVKEGRRTQENEETMTGWLEDTFLEVISESRSF